MFTIGDQSMTPPIGFAWVLAVETAEAWHFNPNWWEAIGTAGSLLLLVVGSLWTKLFLRPRLRVSYDNASRCRRRTALAYKVRAPCGPGSSAVQEWLGCAVFYRLEVRNRGWSVARNVKGFATEQICSDGRPIDYFDPIQLHWVGTEFTTTNLDLLPGQTEYLDVIRICYLVHDGNVLSPEAVPFDYCTGKPSSQWHFELIPQIETARGIARAAPTGGQVITVSVSGENATDVQMELRLPEQLSIPADPWLFNLAVRRLTWTGHPMEPWDLRPVSAS